MNELTRNIGKQWQEDKNYRRSKAKTLYDLYEGAIEKHVVERIKREIEKAQDAKEISYRILEVNLVKRIVSKVARAYKIKPIRRMINGTPQDQEMFDWYDKQIDFDLVGKKIDKSYNNYKEVLVDPYMHERTLLPRIKVYEPFEYIVVSTDPQDKTIPNIIVRDYGNDANGKQMLACTSDTDFWIQNVAGDILTEEMAKIENFQGLNPFGAMPYQYAREAESTVMPYPDDSLINTATLIPMLCGDINFAIKYMSFGMVWGRNVRQELVERAPNAFLNLVPADENSPVMPEVGTIKPELDINQVFDGIMLQLQLWLNSRGITASVIKSNESVASGIAKMIDEADVTSLVTNNQVVYKNLEHNLFDFIMHKAHDIWKLSNMEIPQQSFSPDCYIETQFTIEAPIKTEQELIDEEVSKLRAGFTSKRAAIARINQGLSQEELDELIEEIMEDEAKIKAAKQEEMAAKFGGGSPFQKSPIEEKDAE